MGTLIGMKLPEDRDTKTYWKVILVLKLLQME
jgi:hypothetical protein